MASKTLLISQFIFIFLLSVQTLPTIQLGHRNSYFDRPEGWPGSDLFVVPPPPRGYYYNFTAYIDLSPITKSLSHKGYNFMSQTIDKYVHLRKISNTNSTMQLISKITVFAPPPPGPAVNTSSSSSGCLSSLIGHKHPGRFGNHVIRLWLDRDTFYSSWLASPAAGSLLPIYVEAAVPDNVFTNGFGCPRWDFGYECPDWDGFVSLNDVRIKDWNLSYWSGYDLTAWKYVLPKQNLVVRLDVDSKFDLFDCYDH